MLTAWCTIFFVTVSVHSYNSSIRYFTETEFPFPHPQDPVESSAYFLHPLNQIEE
jgi:hypothetical protein